MSQQTGQESRAAADSIDDFATMSMRQTGLSTFVVVNWGGDETTGYKVDVARLECQCMDQKVRGDDGHVCKHLAYAIKCADSHITAEEMAVHSLAETVGDATQVLKEMEQYRTSLKADRAAAVSGGSQDGSADTESEGVDDPVAALYDHLESRGVPESEVEAWIDDQYGSLQFKTNYLEDEQYNTFMSWVSNEDDIKWDRDNSRNYIKKADIDEVLG